jgi:PadR family transcriptional regulator PadR
VIQGIQDDAKWEAQLRKGCLELAILATIGKGRLYGLEILRGLQASPSLAVSEGTVYPILSRLKAEGWLQSEWVEAERGHPRKYYQLTESGRRRAVEMARFWEQFAAGLSALTRPLWNGEEKTDDRP